MYDAIAPLQAVSVNHQTGFVYLELLPRGLQVTTQFGVLEECSFLWFWCGCSIVPVSTAFLQATHYEGLPAVGQ